MLREAATSLNGPPATPKRLVLVARIVILAMIPFVMLPTGLSHLSRAQHGWHASAAWVHATVWWIAAAVSLACSAFIWARGGRGLASRWCMFATLAALMTTNQASMLAAGSMTSWGVLYVVALIAAGRISLDYDTAAFGVALGIVGLTVGALLEWSHLVPLAPFAPRPIVHFYYEDASLAATNVLAANLAVVLTFLVVNYAMNQQLKLHRYITDTVLRRYLPPSMVERASRGELSLDEAPERRTVTVLFCDLVGFSAMSERLGADAVATHLNTYLSAMADLAHQHGATVDKFIGDAVMLVYGAPEPMPPAEQALRMVRLAREMLRVAAKLPGEKLDLRVGVTTGEAIVGNFGSEHRSDYTVIGPVVNLAARLETAAPPGRVMVGPQTAALLPDDIELEPAGPLQLKGFAKPVEAWLVVGDHDGTQPPASNA
jgi:class 3 adenylate cyclase